MLYRFLDERSNYYSSESAYHSLHWIKFILVTGKLGSRKTHLLLTCIDHALATNNSVAVGALTGTLPQTLSNNTGQAIHCDTLHLLFMFSDTPENCKYNWRLAQYDVIFIDEISHVSTALFSHIMQTLPKLLVRPVLFLSGDVAQQQPLGTLNSVTMPLPNISSDPVIMDHIVQFTLHYQFRCTNNILLQFLDTIRAHIPTDIDLQELMQDRVLIPHYTHTTDVYTALSHYPHHIVLTMTTAATQKIKKAIIDHTFHSSIPLCTLTLHHGHQYSIYKHMKVMLTRNCNKSLGFVSGQFGTVITMQRLSLIIKTRKGQMLTIHPLTEKTDDRSYRTFHPCIPAYTCTIAKMQGQTVENTCTLPCSTAYVALS